jgi:hypothetical protein
MSDNSSTLNLNAIVSSLLGSRVQLMPNSEGIARKQGDLLGALDAWHKRQIATNVAQTALPNQNTLQPVLRLDSAGDVLTPLIEAPQQLFLKVVETLLSEELSESEAEHFEDIALPMQRAYRGLLALVEEDAPLLEVEWSVIELIDRTHALEDHAEHYNLTIDTLDLVRGALHQSVHGLHSLKDAALELAASLPVHDVFEHVALCGKDLIADWGDLGMDLANEGYGTCELENVMVKDAGKSGDEINLVQLLALMPRQLETIILGMEDGPSSMKSLKTRAEALRNLANAAEATDFDFVSMKKNRTAFKSRFKRLLLRVQNVCNDLANLPEAKAACGKVLKACDEIETGGAKAESSIKLEEEKPAGVFAQTAPPSETEDLK